MIIIILYRVKFCNKLCNITKKVSPRVLFIVVTSGYIKFKITFNQNKHRLILFASHSNNK